MPSSGLMLSNGGTGGNGGRMDGTLSQSMDSVNTVAPEEEVIESTNHLLCISGPAPLSLVWQPHYSYGGSNSCDYR